MKVASEWEKIKMTNKKKRKYCLIQLNGMEAAVQSIAAVVNTTCDKLLRASLLINTFTFAVIRTHLYMYAARERATEMRERGYKHNACRRK